MKKSPLEQAKERFGVSEKEPQEARAAAKKQLVSAIREFEKSGLWVDRLNSDKGLEHVSNKKLLHLLETLNAVKESFGDRESLVAEIAKLERREKDQGFQDRLGRYPTPRLWDTYRLAKRRVGKTAAWPLKPV